MQTEMEEMLPPKLTKNRKKDSYNGSHLHALNLVSDVEHEVVVAHHLYVVEQAHDETADAVHDTTPQKG